MLTAIIDYVSAGLLSGQRSVFGYFGAPDTTAASGGWLHGYADLFVQNVSELDFREWGCVYASILYTEYFCVLFSVCPFERVTHRSIGSCCSSR